MSIPSSDIGAVSNHCYKTLLISGKKLVSAHLPHLQLVLTELRSHIGVPFLNLIANLQERAGGVYIRIGGNTQEFAVMVEPDSEYLRPDHTFGKTDSGTQQTV